MRGRYEDRMSQLLDSYRRNAAAARLDAERATLPNVRARALEAATRWLDLADRLEWVEERTANRLASRAREADL